jgi:hypothetical protein
MALDVDDLLTQIDTDLGVAVSASMQNSRALDNLYEAFLFGSVLRAARAISGHAIRWRNLTGPNGDEVRLRGSPGEIYSAHFSIAMLSFAGDIAVLHAGRGAWRRARKERPAPIDVFLAIEAKAYDGTSIDLAIGRAVLGLRTELQQPRVALVAATAIPANVQHLMTVWGAGAFPGVVPGSVESDQFIAALSAVLES